ncbi:serrate RNA effector molecule-like isoform X1 [Dinothrombium tinctorium]|uniref:Serrate RNA effector molecule homolog n=1 Tax=Dinothrombium tinctorium TaxID=1965070 RepID=A0A3S5WGU2_9ACAR|nr:Serrate RNA effector molecule-like protein [Dinothrombium tinctorium]RWS07634.1 serrate RNA effector molecule-like isoform X1 [Dinothrombium tinctorium]
MGDSDEEYDRRRVRDKFRRERSDYQDRNAGNRREDWPDGREGGGFWNNGPSGKDRMQNRAGSRDYGRDYGGQRRDRYGGSPGDRSDMSPPVKRMRGRNDWDDRGYDGYGHSGWPMDSPMPSGHGPSYGMSGSGHSNQRENDNTPTQPAMMTFKQFIAGLDDSVDDQESSKKYNEYKMDFKRQQIDAFFRAHKDEEWFRSRYHPEECGKRKAEFANSLKNRLRVFLDLFESGLIDSVSIDVEKSEQITRLLDAAVIKLEGGTDFDLKALDENFEDDKAKEPDLLMFSVDVEKSTEKKNTEWPTENRENRASIDNEENTEDGECKSLTQSAIKSEKIEDGEEDSKEADEKVEDDSEEPKPENFDEASKQSGENTDGACEDDEKQVANEDAAKNKDENINGPPVKTEETSEENTPKPRPLHKTASIFLRNLAPTITKQEVEAMCKKFPGFLRVAIADPQPERRFYRRGWVTFERHVNIRDICWQLNEVRLRDCELGAIVNRDLSRRIRSVNGIASHKNVVRADIRHAARIVHNLDQQKKLWEEEGEKSEETKSNEEQPSFGFQSKNPLLKNITDYLIEEASAEEEELLGAEAGELENEDGPDGQSLERDENLIKVLDRLLLYLRIVHSVDYYNSSEYPNEDEMPNRIGIMHARGSPPSSKITIQEINEYIKNFEAKIQPFLQTPVIITEEEALKLGKKNAETEVEKFINDNTQELAKDKWLCPLSGKKFRGPNFVRKHILNKHNERLEEVRKDVEYFNNYLMDPKRPQLPEHPSNRPQNNQTNQRDGHGTNQNMPNMSNSGPWPIPHGPYPGPPPYLPPYGTRGVPPMGFGGIMAGWNAPGRSYPPMGPPIDYARGAAARGRYGRREPRDLVGYHDLGEDLDMI